MANLTITLATLAVLILLVDASIYRTTTVIHEEAGAKNPRHTKESCWRQIERQQNLWHCQQHIIEESQGGFTPGRRDGDGPSVLLPRQQHLDMCCEQLDDLSTGCVCEGLQKAVEEQKQQGQLMGRDVSKAYEVARNLPAICNLEPHDCQFGSGYGF